MQLTQTRPTTQRSNDQAYFLTAYRDHLLGELAEVERRLAELPHAPASPPAPRTVGLES